MKRLQTAASGLFESFSTLFLVSILVVVLLQVFFRYVARIAVPWTEEAARYLCIWMVFMGVVAAIGKEAHIRVSFLIDRMPQILRGFFELLSYAVVFLFNLIVFLGSLELVRLNWGQEAVTFPISVGMLYIAVAVSSFFSLLFLPALFYQKAKALFTGRWKCRSKADA